MNQASVLTLLNALGGLGLFLLAMAMMTDGLKAAAGHRLRLLLARWTATPLRGAGSGALMTALVQSSSAVTVATIGFVNAGVLSLAGALAVVFGANVGTTMTGWLVSITGFGFKIEALALPLVAVGSGLRLLARRAGLKGLGDALLGFGLFFLGLAFLKEGFGGFGAAFDLQALGEGGIAATFLLIGRGGGPGAARECAEKAGGQPRSEKRRPLPGRVPGVGPGRGRVLRRCGGDFRRAAPADARPL